MKELNRRDFVRFAAASAALMAGSACTDPDTQEDVDPNAGLSEEEVLRRLDEKVDRIMATAQHCAQTTFIALQEQFDLEDGAIVKALTPLPGIAERGETCGAVIGGLMALGLVYGRDRLNDWEGYRASLEPARRFCSRFEESLGSMNCSDIVEQRFGQRLDLADPEDHATFQASGPTEKCREVVREAVHIAARIIMEKNTG